MNLLHKIGRGIATVGRSLYGILSGIRDRLREQRELMAQSEQHRPRYPPEPIYSEPDFSLGGETAAKQWYLVEIDHTAIKSAGSLLQCRIIAAGQEARFGRIVEPNVPRWEPREMTELVTFMPSFIVVEMEMDEELYKIVRRAPGVERFGTLQSVEMFQMMGHDPLTLIPGYNREYREPTVDYDHAF